MPIWKWSQRRLGGGSKEAQKRLRRGSKTIKIMKDLEPTTQAHAHLRLTRHTETRQCREKRYVQTEIFVETTSKSTSV